ncbi:hypothetical protein HHK36_028776 [Tetracentron sinense]|uniref:Neprosin PEP catalytic domain-containing protein n=1 Tax=Tetracentron sinense TaxID=13715 RepID=A0A835D0J4_TETSI|nr:hypothetical protein HHK36_028776 [Tetracentron sinense]
MDSRVVSLVLLLACPLILSYINEVEGGRKLSRKEDMELEKQLKLLNKPAVMSIKYAVIGSDQEMADKYYGIGGVFNLYNPSVLGFQLSSAKVKIENKADIITAGWMDEDTGDWWLNFGTDNTPIGFWPKSIFTDLAGFGFFVGWGGEVVSLPDLPSPPMGSSLVNVDDPAYAAYYMQMIVVDQAHNVNPPNDTKMYEDNHAYYSVNDGGETGEYWGHYIMYGGPVRANVLSMDSRVVSLVLFVRALILSSNRVEGGRKLSRKEDMELERQLKLNKTAVMTIQDEISGNCWLNFGTDISVGFWPKHIFTDLASSSFFVGWGGEVASLPGLPSPPMGAGLVRVDDLAYAAYIRKIIIVNADRDSVDAFETKMYGDNHGHYSVNDVGENGDYWGHYLMYGGPSGIKQKVLALPSLPFIHLAGETLSGVRSPSFLSSGQRLHFRPPATSPVYRPASLRSSSTPIVTIRRLQLIVSLHRSPSPIVQIQIAGIPISGDFSSPAVIILPFLAKPSSGPLRHLQAPM